MTCTGLVVVNIRLIATAAGGIEVPVYLEPEEKRSLGGGVIASIVLAAVVGAVAVICKILMLVCDLRCVCHRFNRPRRRSRSCTRYM